MPLNFPANPTLNQIHSIADRSWKWNGVGWRAVSAELNKASELDGGAAATVFTTGAFTLIDGGAA